MSTAHPRHSTPLLSLPVIRQYLVRFEMQKWKKGNKDRQKSKRPSYLKALLLRFYKFTSIRRVEIFSFPNFNLFTSTSPTGSLVSSLYPPISPDPANFTLCSISVCPHIFTRYPRHCCMGVNCDFAQQNSEIANLSRQIPSPSRPLTHSILPFYSIGEREQQRLSLPNFVQRQIHLLSSRPVKLMTKRYELETKGELRDLL